MTNIKAIGYRIEVTIVIELNDTPEQDWWDKFELIKKEATFSTLREAKWEYDNKITMKVSLPSGVTKEQFQIEYDKIIGWVEDANR
jgi:hypothetical protein